MHKKNLKTTLRQWNSIFCGGMTCKANRGRDVAVVFATMIIAAGFLYLNARTNSPGATFEKKGTANSTSVADGNQEISVMGDISEPILTEKDIASQAEDLINSVDLTGWKTFNNQFFGFTVKYPGEWLSPKSQKKSAGSKWEARYQFRTKDAGENPYLGFDVAIYDVPKTKELLNTEEYPVIKNADLKNEIKCQNIEGHAIDVDDFPAEEIYIPPTDDCYNPALFFSIVKERYIYNITPISKAEAGQGDDPRIAINDNFPEYYAAASTLELIDIVRPKPAPPKPKITAPKPVSYKVVGGKLVCAKKNDKPRKSRQNKGKHLDMECCLDPDEYPNPWCTY